MSQKLNRVALYLDHIAGEYPDYKIALILKHPSDMKEDVMLCRDSWPLVEVIETIAARLGRKHEFIKVSGDYCNCEEPKYVADQDGIPFCTVCLKCKYPA